MGTSVALGPSPEFAQLVISTRLQGAQEAIKRSRYAFLATTIASTSVFIAEWNAYLSWYRRFPLKINFPKNEVTEEAFKRVLQQYAESRVITISLLGIHIGVSDLVVLGTFALFVCSLWMFFSFRRENHVIGTLLVDTFEDSVDLRRYVYHGVSSFLVFTTSTLSDAPISSLDKAEMQTQRIQPQSFSSRFLRFAVSMLFFFPALVAFSTMVFDILSLYVFQAALGYPHDPLGYGALEPYYKVQLIIMEIIGLAFSFSTALICYKLAAFEKSVTRLLQQYSEALDLVVGH